MAGLSLELVKGNSYYLSGRLSIGVYVKDKQAILFDSGLDDAGAKKIEKELKKHGVTVAAIVNTHHHVDHCGGNNYFQKTIKNLKIYSTAWEKAFIEHPFLETCAFCCGAEPHAGLRNRHIEAAPSKVTDVIEIYEDQEITILGEKFQIITLPGHTAGMIGIITPDNVLYCGDAVFGQETFLKHDILFYTNISDSILSLQKIKQLKVDVTVLFHGGPEIALPELCEKHVVKLEQTAELMLKIIKDLKLASIDAITQYVMQYFNLPDDITRFALTRTSVVAFVSYLEHKKMLDIVVSAGMLKAQHIEVQKKIC